MPGEGAERRRERERHGLAPLEELRERRADHEPRRRDLEVPLDAGQLPGEEDRRVLLPPEEPVEVRRAVDVRVPVEHPVPDEDGVREARERPEDPPLLADLQLRLEADEVEVLPREVVLPELDDGVRLASRLRVAEAERLHRPVPERLDAPLGHRLDRQAPLEVDGLLEVVEGDLLAARGAPPTNASYSAFESGTFR